MSLITLVRFLHIFLAVVWLGGAIYLEGLMAVAKRGDDSTAPLYIYVRAHETNRRLLSVAGIGTVLFGFWLVLDLPWSFSMFWVALSIALALVALGMSILYFGPRGGKAVAAVAANGLDDPGAVAALMQVRKVAHIQTALLTIVLVMMVFKPLL